MDPETVTASVDQAAETGGYNYTLADGTEVHADNRRQVFEMCSVMAKKAIESPDEVDMLLELASIGNKAMEEARSEAVEARTEPQPKPKAPERPAKKVSVELVESEIVERPGGEKLALVIQDEVSTAVHENVLVDEPVEKFQVMTDAFLAREAERQSAEALQRQFDADRSTQPNEAQQQPEITPPTEFVAALPAPEVAAVIDTSPAVIVPTIIGGGSLAELVPEASEIIQNTVVAEERTSELLQPEETVGFEAFETLELNLAAVEVQEIPLENTVIIDEQLERQFDKETIEVYQQLVAVEELESGIEVVSLELETFAITDTPVTLSIEDFIAEQPPSEETLTFETLQSRADEQPLEQTLLQLAKLIEQAREVPEEDAVSLALTELQKVIAESRTSEDTADTAAKITPEMTEKLLTLLRALGYQEPGEVLLNFVAKYDFTFLSEFLEYIAELNSATNRREFLASMATPTAPVDNRQRFARLLLSVMSRVALEPSAA